jgi:predicted phage terminase large subunit-like protein
LLDGNWNIRHEAGKVFAANDFEDRAFPTQYPRLKVRGWDLAATPVPIEKQPKKKKKKGRGPDWTRGVLIARDHTGEVVVEDVVSLRDKPGKVADKILETARKDKNKVVIALWQDPGAGGLYAAEDLEAKLQAEGFHVVVIRAAKSKIEFATPFAEVVEHGKVYVVDGIWKKAYLDELEAFPDGDFDDQVDASSLAYLVLNDLCPWTATPIKPPNIVPARSTAPLRASRY